MDLNAPRPANDDLTLRTNDAGVLPLSVEGLSFKSQGEQLIDNISFQLVAGPRTVILGPNGAGKSLLLRLCHGLIEPSSGSVRWSIERAQERQAMVFQRPVLLRRTAAANVEYGLKLRDTPKPERQRIVEEVLNRTGLARLAGKPARLLSGGEQQKLALARAWALKPEVLFLDEPTASLDPAATYGVEQVVERMHAEGTQIVMTTHDLGQARRLADQVLFIHKGRLLEKTPAVTFFEAPESGEAAAFLRGELRW